MLRRLLGGCVALGVVALAAGCFSERNGTGPSGGSCLARLDPSQYGSVVVAIENFLFTPTPTHVKAGGKVTWVNCEPAGTPSHTTTADAGLWDSGLLDPGQDYTVTFNAAGTFAYHCDVHPGMVAQIIVDP